MCVSPHYFILVACCVLDTQLGRLTANLWSVFRLVRVYHCRTWPKISHKPHRMVKKRDDKIIPHTDHYRSLLRVLEQVRASQCTGMHIHTHFLSQSDRDVHTILSFLRETLEILSLSRTHTILSFLREAEETFLQIFRCQRPDSCTSSQDLSFASPYRWWPGNRRPRTKARQSCCTAVMAFREAA